MLIIDGLADRPSASFAAARVAKQRQTPTRRRTTVSSYIVLLCLTVADPVPALGAAAVLDTSTMASAGEDIAALALSGANLPEGLEPVRLATLSGEWKTFLEKTRINRLPRSIARSLRRLDKEKWWPTGRRRKVASSLKSRYHRDGAISPKTNQIAIERVAIPQPRPTGITQDDEPGLVLAAPAVTRLSELLSGSRLFVGSATACLVLMAAYLTHHYRTITFHSRKRIRSEKVLYNAIAKLPQEAAGFESAVGTILDFIEEAYGLSAASIAVFDRETVAIQSVYTSQARAPTKDSLIDEAIDELNMRSGLTDQALWRYPEPAVDGTDDQAEPDAVTSVAWHGTRTGVMMTAKCRPGRYMRATDANTLQLVTQILANVIDGRRGIAPSFPSSASRIMMHDSGEELAGAIAHEFNNLLMPIMGYAEMAADALNPGSYPRTYVERIQSAGERAKRVVEQILAFSRQQEHSCESFDVAAATAEILHDLKMCVPASTKFRVRLPDAPVRLRGNALTLQQAVLNLCKNAGEAVADGGTITVGVSVIEQNTSRKITHGELTPGRYVRVSVSDTGAGISIPDLRRIFVPFFTTRGEEGGTGLGLPMVLRAIKLFDGCINVRSSPSRGTRFDLFLPYPNLSGHDKCDATDLCEHVGLSTAE